MTAAQTATAGRLITAKGQTVTLTRRASGAYNTATGLAAITTTTQTGKGVILPLGGYRKVNGTSIVVGDETMLLSALDASGAALVPEVGDYIADAAGDSYAVTVVDTLRPDGSDIMHDLVVRRAA